jgi:hypothetical protein
MRTLYTVTTVTANVKADHCFTVSAWILLLPMGCLKGTMYNILHNNLGLVKKSARLVPKLLSEEQKKERVKICTDFVASMHGHSMSMLDNIVMMDETWYPTTHLKKRGSQSSG